MKARIPLSNRQLKVLKQEMDRQAAESSAQWDSEFEAMMLWCLHIFAGFGKKRLLAFRKLFVEEAKKLREHYEIDDVGYTAKYKLKKIGVDVDTLIEQDSEG